MTTIAAPKIMGVSEEREEMLINLIAVGVAPEPISKTEYVDMPETATQHSCPSQVWQPVAPSEYEYVPVSCDQLEPPLLCHTKRALAFCPLRSSSSNQYLIVALCEELGVISKQRYNSGSAETVVQPPV